MNGEPTVSVLMPVYNAEYYVREAVDSILAQTYDDFEFVIVDDGSTDETAAILASYSDPRIRVIHNGCNFGLGYSLNRGLEVARGTYVARQDADDVSLTGRLAAQVEYLQSHSDVGLVGSTTWFMHADGRLAYVFPNPITDLDAKWTMLSHNAFSHTSVMFRRSLLQQCGNYPETLEYRYCEDYDLWSRFGRHMRVANLQTPLVNWRMNEKSVSHSNVRLQLQQVSCVARNNLRWVMGWKEVDARLWAAWRKFWYTPGVDPVRFERDEVELLAELLLNLTNRFYLAYGLRGPEVRQHRRRVHYLWGRHALGLSYKPGSGSSPAARRALLSLGMRLLATALLPRRSLKTHSGDPGIADAELEGETDTATTQHARSAGGSSSV